MPEEKIDYKKIDFYVDFLTSIMECGFYDLQRLYEVYTLATKFGITVDDIISSAEDIGATLDFNSIMYVTMRIVLDAIADKVEDTEPEVADKLRDWDVLVNYMDSWFNIECLDELRTPEEIEAISTDELAKKVVQEMKSGEANAEEKG